ncbi:hypothetical protein [Chitinophaga filiformis]|uniref:Uncharacterized protein n=1 Tax=Chitinophaga filiformis TaxID=104663 RepID=A0ABY4I7M0_CHIFI|nr:hypothetical protein [Chitinophaga filiformis]UPK71580.1 hypothetical protein MYF79_09840 [Chitinophaga filiformis]
MALSKIFTIRYYAQNTGFFLVIFYFFFGIVPGGQLLSYHQTLIKGFTGNMDFLALVCLAWLLYNLKCMAFVVNVLSAKDHTFLYGTLGVLEGAAKWRTWLWLHVTLYAPILIYSCIATAIAMQLHFYSSALVIGLFNVIMIFAPLWVYDRKMKHPGTASFLARWQQWLNRNIRKPVWAMYGYELLNNDTKSLAIAKVVSGFVVIATCSLMGNTYDERFILVGFLVCILFQVILIYNHRRFDDLYLSLLPQLPLPVWKRYLQTGLLYLVLLLPESILLTYKVWQQAAPAHLIMLLATGVSVLMLLRSLLYFPRMDQDKYLRWVLIIFVSLLFLGLARLYWYGIALLQVPAFTIFYNRYYRYEAPLEKVD